ncbi:GNAT family N-acetyltransferase [Vibrio harveyi]
MIITDNIFLRPLEKQDLPSRVKWLNDPDIYQTLVSDYPVSLAKTEAWFSKGLFDQSKVHFSILDRKSERLIGMTGLLQIDTRHSKAQMYITIGESEFHGRRYPDEIIPQLLKFAFEELNLNKVYLWTIPENSRGRRVYERNGFVKEAEMKEHMYCRGKFQTIIQHRVLKSEFECKSL